MPNEDKIRYKVGEKIYNIPSAEKDAFLTDFKDAVEVKGYSVGDKKYNIPVDQVSDFLKDMPDAKALDIEMPKPIDTGQPADLGKPVTAPEPGVGGGLPSDGTPGKEGGQPKFATGVEDERFKITLFAPPSTKDLKGEMQKQNVDDLFNKAGYQAEWKDKKTEIKKITDKETQDRQAYDYFRDVQKRIAGENESINQAASDLFKQIENQNIEIEKLVEQEKTADESLKKDLNFKIIELKRERDKTGTNINQLNNKIQQNTKLFQNLDNYIVKYQIEKNIEPESFAEKPIKPEIPTSMEQALQKGDKNALMPQFDPKVFEAFDFDVKTGAAIYNPEKDFSRKMQELDNIKKTNPTQYNIDLKEFNNQLIDFKGNQNKQFEKEFSTLLPIIDQQKQQVELLNQQLQNPNLSQQERDAISNELNLTSQLIAENTNTYDKFYEKYQANNQYISTTSKIQNTITDDASTFEKVIDETGLAVTTFGAALWNNTAPSLVKAVRAISEINTEIQEDIISLISGGDIPPEALASIPLPNRDLTNTLRNLEEDMTAQYPDDPRLQKDFMDDPNLLNSMSFFGGAVGTIATAVTTGGTGVGLQSFGQMYDYGVENGLNAKEAAVFALPYTIVSAYLGPKGVDALAKKVLTETSKTTLKRVLAKESGKLTYKELLAGGTQFVKETGKEFLTGVVEGAVQEVSELGFKEYKPTTTFKEKTLTERGVSSLKSGVAEAVGSMPVGLASIIGSRKNLSNVVAESISNPKAEERLMSDLDALLNTNDITQQQYDETIKIYDLAKQSNNQIPANIINSKARGRAIELIMRQKDIENELKNVNEAMSAPLKTELNGINKELNDIATNKWKVPAEKEKAPSPTAVPPIAEVTPTEAAPAEAAPVVEAKPTEVTPEIPFRELPETPVVTEAKTIEAAPVEEVKAEVTVPKEAPSKEAKPTETVIAPETKVEIKKSIQGKEPVSLTNSDIKEVESIIKSEIENQSTPLDILITLNVNGYQIEPGAPAKRFIDYISDRISGKQKATFEEISQKPPVAEAAVATEAAPTETAAQPTLEDFDVINIKSVKGRKAREELKARVGEAAYKKMDMVNKKFEETIKDLEDKGILRKECP